MTIQFNDVAMEWYGEFKNRKKQATHSAMTRLRRTLNFGEGVEVHCLKQEQPAESRNMREYWESEEGSVLF